MDIVTIVKIRRIKVNRQGYTPDGRYIGVGRGPMFYLEFYYHDGKSARSITNADSYAELRRELAAIKGCKVLR
jgi:hypothetical protein